MSRPNCEQCGALNRRDLIGNRRNRTRSRCCHMLLCDSCIRSNDTCFACKPVSVAKDHVAAALRLLEEADALLALPNLSAIRTPVSEALAVLRVNLPHYQAQEAA